MSTTQTPNPATVDRRVADVVATLIERAGMTWLDLAERADVPASRVGRWSRDHASLSVDEFAKVAAVFGLLPSELLAHADARPGVRSVVVPVPDATGRWLGPDGIWYASEADYRDSWGKLDEACRKLTAAQVEVEHDGAGAVVECEPDAPVAGGDWIAPDAVPAPKCPAWCAVDHADDVQPLGNGLVDASDGYYHRRGFGAEPGDALVEVTQWQRFDGRFDGLLVPEVTLHAPDELTPQDARGVALALVRAAELVEASR